MQRYCTFYWSLLALCSGTVSSTDHCQLCVAVLYVQLTTVSTVQPYCTSYWPLSALCSGTVHTTDHCQHCAPVLYILLTTVSTVHIPDYFCTLVVDLSTYSMAFTLMPLTLQDPRRTKPVHNARAPDFPLKTQQLVQSHALFHWMFSSVQNSNIQVHCVTSSFCHCTKRHISYRVTVLPENLSVITSFRLVYSNTVHSADQLPRCSSSRKW